MSVPEAEVERKLVGDSTRVLQPRSSRACFTNQLAIAGSRLRAARRENWKKEN